jgi:methyl-accepting chemotaxis protein
MNLRHFRIGTRLAFGFGTILAIMLAALVATNYLDDRSRAALATALEGARAKETLAAEMRAVSLAQSSAMRNIALHSEIKQMQDEEARARKLGTRYDELVAQLGKRELSAEERGIVDELVKIDKALDAPLLQALGMATSFRPEEAAKVLMSEIDPLVQKSQDALERLIKLQDAANQRTIEAANAQAARLRTFVYLLALALTAASAVVAWLTTRSITRPLTESVAIARRVSAGDLTARIEVTGRDEPAQLQTALKEMNAGLGAMVQQIRQGSESIAVGAGQVAAGNQELSGRTEEHASSLEETASTLEEFTAAVRQSAAHAKKASELAGTASTTAEKGGEVVAEVVKTMQGVKTSSARVAEIVGVIDGIAFQTNILALNAAVEAARAGEQGRGFAVVASEVRSLAQRSASSAKEIRGLIDESVGRIEDGARLVESAGRTMDELVVAVKSVAAIMGDIASASNEQTAGIEQINKAIAQMEHVVQTNASLVEEATAAAASMANQAGELTRTVARFRVDESAVAAPPSKPIAPAPTAQRLAPAARTQPPAAKRAKALPRARQRRGVAGVLGSSYSMRRCFIA